jgi:hypothetical protein
MIRNINIFLHRTNPIYRRSRFIPRPGSQLALRIANFNANASRLRTSLDVSLQQAETYNAHKSTIRMFNSVFPLGKIYNRWRDGIRVFLKTKTSRTPRENVSLQQAETYNAHKSTIRMLNSVFPLGKIYNRWRDGIRVFLRTKTSRTPIDHRTSPCMTETIKRMMAADIIKEAKAGPFESNIFLIPKSNGLMRPVINLHHLVEYSDVPRFYLPSIFQIIRNKPWGAGLYYIKFDFKNAFFNIELHPKTYKLNNIYYGGKNYECKRLPFGASISPFVM